MEEIWTDKLVLTGRPGREHEITNKNANIIARRGVTIRTIAEHVDLCFIHILYKVLLQLQDSLIETKKETNMGFQGGTERVRERDLIGKHCIVIKRWSKIYRTL